MLLIRVYTNVCMLGYIWHGIWRTLQQQQTFRRTHTITVGWSDRNSDNIDILPLLTRVFPASTYKQAVCCSNLCEHWHAPLPLFPSFFQLCRTNRFYDANFLPDFCGLPPFFSQLWDSNRVLLVKCVTPLVLFLPTFAALPTKPGCMLQNPFKSCGLLLLDKIIAVFSTDLVDNALYVDLYQTIKIKQ